MRRNIRGALLPLLILSLFGSGCITKRFVTTQQWHDEDTLYIAYTEAAPSESTARVQKCSRQANNALLCSEQTELNTVLNDGK